VANKGRLLIAQIDVGDVRGLILIILIACTAFVGSINQRLISSCSSTLALGEFVTIDFQSRSIPWSS
jgi:hypothetical protein